MPGFDVAAARGLPDSTYKWTTGLTTDGNALIKNDPKGNYYALLANYGFDTCSMGYLVKDGANWSAASTLGSGCYSY